MPHQIPLLLTSHIPMVFPEHTLLNLSIGLFSGFVPEKHLLQSFFLILSDSRPKINQYCEIQLYGFVMRFHAKCFG